MYDLAPRQSLWRWRDVRSSAPSATLNRCEGSRYQCCSGEPEGEVSILNIIQYTGQPTHSSGLHGLGLFISDDTRSGEDIQGCGEHSKQP
jgi:hypothetical protein